MFEQSERADGASDRLQITEQCHDGSRKILHFHALHSGEEAAESSIVILTHQTSLSNPRQTSVSNPEQTSLSNHGWSTAF